MRKGFIVSTILIAFSIISMDAGIIYSQAKKPSPPAPQQKAVEKPVSQKFDIGDFTFTTKNRRDPFERLYIERTKKGKEVRFVKGKRIEAVKQGYELEELKLVGVLKKEKNSYAMLEDLQGKGMLMKKGDFINPKVSIIDITENKVVFGYKLKNDMKKIELEIKKK